MSKAVSTLAEAGLEKIRVLSPPVVDPISPEEYMAALQWQLDHPTHRLVEASAETVARMLRRLAAMKREIN